jgi:uncharacterized protein YjlB
VANLRSSRSSKSSSTRSCSRHGQNQSVLGLLGIEGIRTSGRVSLSRRGDRHDEAAQSGSYPASKLITTSASPSPLYNTALEHITMPSAVTSVPETYFLTKPTAQVPNSRLPVLVYRDVLPSPTPESICAAIEPNHWIKGGVFKHYPAHHFHSVTHELYAVFKGHSRLLLGRGPLDQDSGIEVELKTGDCIVLPAGVAHCCRNTISFTCITAYLASLFVIYLVH